MLPVPGIQVIRRAIQGCAVVHYDPPFPPEVGWHLGHLDSLAVVHLDHMESEAVDSTDRGHEAARGPIKATTLIDQYLWEAEPVERDSGWGAQEYHWVGIWAVSEERRGGKRV